MRGTNSIYEGQLCLNFTFHFSFPILVFICFIFSLSVEWLYIGLYLLQVVARLDQSIFGINTQEASDNTLVISNPFHLRIACHRWLQR